LADSQIAPMAQWCQRSSPFLVDDEPKSGSLNSERAHMTNPSRDSDFARPLRYDPNTDQFSDHFRQRSNYSRDAAPGGCGCGWVLLLGIILFLAYSGSSCDAGDDSNEVTTPSQEAGDLGITGSPISNVSCDGSYLLITHSMVDPDSYYAEVAAAFSAVPGAKYLRTDQSCSSFAHSSIQGYPIYAVYLGPFDTPAEALTHCSAGPIDAYVKKLDTAGGAVRKCRN